MKALKTKLTLALLAVAPLASAQRWELGALGGYGFSTDFTVKAPGGSVSAGLKNGPLFGVTGGENTYRYVSGEINYLYRQSNLKLNGNGGDVSFGGHSQFIDFRILMHFSNREARMRPFVAVGGGIAVYTGTGIESSTQPLNQFAALTKTRQTKPALSAAVGLKFRVTEHIGLRLEARDYATRFPDQVIAPVPGASASGWLHNITPMVGVFGIF